MGEFHSSDTQLLQMQDVEATSTDAQSGNCSNIVSINLNEDHQNAVFESNHNFQGGFEMNMIKSGDGSEHKQSKRPLIFNNCVFKNNNFN